MPYVFGYACPWVVTTCFGKFATPHLLHQRLITTIFPTIKLLYIVLSFSVIAADTPDPIKIFSLSLSCLLTAFVDFLAISFV